MEITRSQSSFSALLVCIFTGVLLSLHLVSPDGEEYRNKQSQRHIRILDKQFRWQKVLDLMENKSGNEMRIEMGKSTLLRHTWDELKLTVVYVVYCEKQTLKTVGDRDDFSSP